jgi:hypothetical protein
MTVAVEVPAAEREQLADPLLPSPGESGLSAERHGVLTAL